MMNGFWDMDFLDKQKQRSKRVITNQPQPVDSTFPRYTNRQFPPYTHLPLETPHPFRDSNGHSYGKEEDECQDLTPETWMTNECYLYSIDLYNYSFWWESHEGWEGIWQLCDKQSPKGRFLQALIQIASALIKRHQKRKAGLHSLANKALNNLKFVIDSVELQNNLYMGMDLLELYKQTEKCFLSFLKSPISDKAFERLEKQPLLKLIFPQD